MIPALTGLTPENLAAWLKEAGEPAFRANQILEWVWKKKGQLLRGDEQPARRPARETQRVIPAHRP